MSKERTFKSLGILAFLLSFLILCVLLYMINHNSGRSHKNQNNILLKQDKIIDKQDKIIHTQQIIINTQRVIISRLK